jgi:aryl-alcohol dehydrogenase-like predicted oxidoreductase
MAGGGEQHVGLGLAALGRPAYITSHRAGDLGADRSVGAMRQRTLGVLDTAYAAGVRYFDAARSYGLAEDFLAGWLGSRPDVVDVVVASKWGYRYVGDWQLDSPVHEVKDHSLEAFTTQLGETRALLGDRLDLYQVHSVTDESPVLTDARLQHAIAELRDSGTRVGFSTSGPKQPSVIRRALDIEVGGRRLFSSVQSTWNLLEPSAGPALQEAHRDGIAVVVKECFANGRLAPGSGDTSAGVSAAAAVAEDVGVTIDQLAVAAAVTQPWSPRVLSGAVTADQLASHVAGAAARLPEAARDALAGVAESPPDYWAARAHRPWA